MRTTIRLPDDLLRAAKQRAVETDRTFTALIEDALRQTLARSAPEPSDPEPPFEIHPFDGNGVQPGVDLDDSAALLDRMESR